MRRIIKFITIITPSPAPQQKQAIARLNEVIHPYSSRLTHYPQTKPLLGLSTLCQGASKSASPNSQPPHPPTPPNTTTTQQPGWGEGWGRGSCLWQLSF